MALKFAWVTSCSNAISMSCVCRKPSSIPILAVDEIPCMFNVTIIYVQGIGGSGNPETFTLEHLRCFQSRLAPRPLAWRCCFPSVFSFWANRCEIQWSSLKARLVVGIYICPSIVVLTCIVVSFLSVSVVANFGISCVKSLADPVLRHFVFLHVFNTVLWIFHSRAHTRRDVVSPPPVVISCMFRRSLQCGGCFWFCLIYWLSPFMRQVESSCTVCFVGFNLHIRCRSVLRVRAIHCMSLRHYVCQAFVVVSECGGAYRFPEGAVFVLVPWFVTPITNYGLPLVRY